MQSFQSYVSEWTDGEVKQLTDSARLTQLVIDDIRRNSTNDIKDKNNASTKKKIIATPIKTKPKASGNKKSWEDTFYPT